MNNQNYEIESLNEIIPLDLENLEAIRGGCCTRLRNCGSYTCNPPSLTSGNNSEVSSLEAEISLIAFN